MYESVLIQFIEQLKDELQTVDRIIADLEKLRDLAGAKPARGHPRVPGRQGKPRPHRPRLRPRSAA